jgi:hypothetical protein
MAALVFSSTWRWLTKYNNFLWKIIFIVQLVTVVVITLRLTSVLLGGGDSWHEFHNSYCQENTNVNATGPVINGTFSEDCVYDYKFKKVYIFLKNATIHLPLDMCIAGIVFLV